MILTLFVLLEIVMIVTFFVSYYTKQELLWAINLVLSGTLMIASYHVEIVIHVLDTSLKVYHPVLTSFSYPFMMGINFMFFVVALVFALLDYYDKYGFIIISELKNKFSWK